MRTRQQDLGSLGRKSLAVKSTQLLPERMKIANCRDLVV